MRLVLAFVLALICLASFASASVSCDICGWIVSGAETQLKNNATEEEIITELDKACSIFGPFSAECQTLVAQYVPQIVDLLEQKVSPTEVCQKIGLCPVPTSTTASASTSVAATTSHAAATTTRAAAGSTAASSSGQQSSSGGGSTGGSSGDARRLLRRRK